VNVEMIKKLCIDALMNIDALLYKEYFY